MGQVTIYLDPDTERKMHEAAKRSGLSQSKWIATLIREKTATTWPSSIAELVGAWQESSVADGKSEGSGEGGCGETI
ncbi:MAG: CopG family transcriptional regulator [Desulfuromonadaceae bacterium]|nr:CopG family transcriptional regulator [Desulfuromonadaceae bacterium]